MKRAEKRSWMVEKQARAAEREAQRLIELERMSKEEDLMREYLQQANRRKSVADALGAHAGINEENFQNVQNGAPPEENVQRRMSRMSNSGVTSNEEPEDRAAENAEAVANASAAFAKLDEATADEVLAPEAAIRRASTTAAEMDVTSPQDAAAEDLSSVQDAAVEDHSSVQDPSSLLGGVSLPDQNSSLDSGAAYRVLTEAAADLKDPSQISEGSHRSSGRRRGDGSHRSKGSRDATALAPKPLPLAPEQPHIAEDRHAQRGKPRFDIRPGLVDMAALRKLEQTQVAHRERRVRIADKRRNMYPIQSQVELSPLPQRMIHRHLHHHVHHHGTEEGMIPYEMFDGGSTALPAEANMASAGRETLEPIKYPSSKTSSKKSAPLQKSRSDSQIRLKPLNPAGAPGPAMRKQKSLADSVDSGSSGHLPQRHLQRSGSLDVMDTPRRRGMAS